MTEGDSGTLNAAFTIKLSAASTSSVTVKYNTANFTATAGTDYTALPLSTLAFTPGQTSKTVNVAVKGDKIDEADESFLLKLTAPFNATIADASGTGKIVDNDTSTVSATGATVTEGNSGTVTMNFTLKLSTANSRAVTVKVSTANAATTPATAGTDYTAQANKLVAIPAGALSQTFPVLVNGDLLDEDNEKVGLVLATATNAALGAVTPGTITDDDATPSLSVTDATVLEGKSAPINAAFKVNLSAASGKTVTVNYATSNVTATAGSDYTALPVTALTFAPGQTSKTLNVAVQGDQIDELDETFWLKISTPVNATIADSTGIGTITDDDTATISVLGNTVTEGNSGPVPMTFTIKLSTASDRTVSVKYKTGDAIISPATASLDYTRVALTTLTFAPGTTSHTVSVNVLGDTLGEDNERVGLLLSDAVNAGLGNNIAGTIMNDDPLPAFTPLPSFNYEGDSGTTTMNMRLELFPASGAPVTVKYATADGTATAGVDYQAVPLTSVTFAPGETVKYIAFTVYGDTTLEPTESFVVNFSGNVNCILNRTSENVHIYNDDIPVVARADDIYEGGDFFEGGTLLRTYDLRDNDSGKSLQIISATTPTGNFSGTGLAEIVDNGVRITCPGLAPGWEDIAFDYTVSDGIRQGTATVHITVYVYATGEPTTHAPVANDDFTNLGLITSNTPIHVTMDVLANDTDADGDTLTIISVSEVRGDVVGTGATATIVDNKIQFDVPRFEPDGADVYVEYTISDGKKLSTAWADVAYTVDYFALKTKPKASERGF